METLGIFHIVLVLLLMAPVLLYNSLIAKKNAVRICSVYPLTYREGFRQYVQEVELLIKIVEELNLNQRIRL